MKLAQGDKLADMVDRMPPFPKSVRQVMDITADVNCSPADLVNVIQHDPVITMKILKMVNSAFFALSKPISSARHALAYLGMNTVKNLAVSIAMVDAMPRKDAPGFSSEDFLLHSVMTAILAQSLVHHARGNADSNDCFVAGLLHDFGKAVFAQFQAKEFGVALLKAKEQEVPLYQEEQKIFEVDHAEVGAMLAEKWQLPEELVHCIRLHHDAERPSSMIGDCVFAANQISKKLAIGASGNTIIAPFPDGVAERFSANLDGLIEKLGDIETEKEKAMAFVMK